MYLLSVWKLISFRTDGVQLSLTFATTSVPSAPNVESLVKAGYTIPQGDRIDVFQARRRWIGTCLQLQTLYSVLQQLWMTRPVLFIFADHGGHFHRQWIIVY